MLEAKRKQEGSPWSVHSWTLGVGFAEEERVVREEEVVHSWTLLSNSDSLEHSIPFSLMTEAREDFSAEDEDVWREGITLSDASLGNHQAFCLTVNKVRVGDSFNALHEQ